MFQIDDVTREKAGKIIRSALNGLKRPKAWVGGYYIRDPKTGANILTEGKKGLIGLSHDTEPQYCAMGALFYNGPQDWKDKNLQAATVLVFRQLPDRYLKSVYKDAFLYAEDSPPSFEDWLLNVDYNEAHSHIVEFNDSQSRKTSVVNTFQRAAEELEA